jgi:hypothetical protein
MSTVLMAEFDNPREALAASKLLKKLGSDVKLMKGKFWEDVYMATMIDEGMKEKGTDKVEEIHKKLRLIDFR